MKSSGIETTRVNHQQHQICLCLRCMRVCGNVTSCVNMDFVRMLEFKKDQGTNPNININMCWQSEAWRSNLDNFLMSVL